MKKDYGSIVLIAISMFNLLFAFLAKIETCFLVLMVIFWGYICIVVIINLIKGSKKRLRGE